MKEAFRKLGIGKALFGQLGKIAREKVWILITLRTVIDRDDMQGCPRVDWSVLKVNE